MAFNNVFDSSLIDYSEDFEKQDIIHKNKADKGREIMVERTIYNFVNEKFVYDEFGPLLEEFYNKLDAKLEKMMDKNNGYIENKFTDWSWDGIPETLSYYINKKGEEGECVKAFGAPVEDPYDEDKRNCDAYNIVESIVCSECGDKGKVRKEIIKSLISKIDEYSMHSLEDQYLDD